MVTLDEHARDWVNRRPSEWTEVQRAEVRWIVRGGPRPDLESMGRFAITVHWSEDWATADHETDYIYATEAEAEAAGRARLRTCGAPREWQGFYIISKERDPNSDEPVVERLVIPGIPSSR